MSCLIIQKKLTYSLELNCSNKCFNQADWDFLATTLLQETVLGWIVAGQTPVVTQYDPLAHFCYEFPRGEEDTLRLPHHPGCKDTSSTARTQSSVRRGAKHFNGTQQHNRWVPHGQSLPLFWREDRNTNQMEDITGNRVAIIHKRLLSNWRHLPSQSNPADLKLKGIEPSTLPHHGGKGPTGHHRSVQADLQQRSLHKASPSWTTH